MTLPRPTSLQNPQAGGITILVVLMLLVLFTVTTFGLSRNAIRQSIITGTARQGMEVRNVADAGLEWSMFWVDDQNLAGSGTGASAFQTQLNTLLVNPNLAGEFMPISASGNADMFFTDPTGSSQYFDIRLMRMDKLPVLFTSQNAVATNTPSEALFPDLWAIRADAHYVQGSVDFIHSKEAWISSKSRSINQ